MWRNYLKTAFRNIIRNRVYSLINFIGLSVGIACFLIIFLWVKDELSFDRFHSNSDNIYRVYSEYHEKDNIWETWLTPDVAAPILKDNYSDILDVVRLNPQPSTVKIGDDLFNEDAFYYTDPSLFNIFDFESIDGDPISALNEPNSIVLTESIAEKYFGSENPIGQVLIVNSNNSFNVKAVIKDLPQNTDFDFEILAPYSFLEQTNRMWTSWSFGRIVTYILANETASHESLEASIVGMAKEHAPDMDYIFRLQPLNKIHLFSLKGEWEGMEYVYIFSVAGIFILLMACFNFMSLATAQYTKRAKEIGLRKVVGSVRQQLIKQFITETFLFVIISTILAVILVEVARPTINSLTGKILTLNYLDVSFMGSITLIVTLTTIFAGSYPSFFISAFKPVAILSGEVSKGKKGQFFRKLIVIIQFTISITLIISTFIIFSQLRFIQNKDLGLQPENVVFFPMSGNVGANHLAFKNELLSNPLIEDVTVTSEVPTFMGYGTDNLDWEGKDPEKQQGFSICAIDHDYVNTIGLKIIDGRNISKDFNSDSSNFIINETAAKLLGENPVGKKFRLWRTEGEVVGVVKDFHFKPLSYEIEPLVMNIISNFQSIMLVKLNSDRQAEAVNYLVEKWQAFNPDHQINYQFLDDNIESFYGSENQMARLFTFFTILGILIAIIGLFGLSSYTAELKTKEIGIRKVLGSSIFSIIRMMLKDYTIWIAIAFVLSCPVAYYFMKGWLQNFAFRTELSLFTFLLSGVLALVAAVVSVSILTYRSAVANPAESLRYE